jgi:hypothetical protein
VQNPSRVALAIDADHHSMEAWRSAIEAHMMGEWICGWYVGIHRSGVRPGARLPEYSYVETTVRRRAEGALVPGAPCVGRPARQEDECGSLHVAN